jgi:nucleotide-binding universal stress UspA family protein
MTSGNRLVVALSGRDDDAALISYANAVAELNRAVARVPAENRGRRAGRPLPGAALAEAADRLVVTAPRSVECVHVSAARAAEQLLATAAEPATDALLVGEGVGWQQARDLVRRATCSVWFVPRGAATVFQRILVPVSFSVRAADCLRVATVLAKLNGKAVCLALHVYCDDSILADPVYDRVLRLQAAEAYSRFIRPIDTLGVPVTPILRDGVDVARAVNRTATEQAADLIVVGSRGRTRAGALLCASLAERVLGECPVPMLVVKHFGARRGALSILVDPDFGRRNDLRFG